MKLYTSEQLKNKYKGMFIDVYPHYYEKRDRNNRYIIVYEVRGVSKTLKENYNLPEDCF